MTDPTPTESNLTASDLAHALAHTPAAHIDLRAHLLPPTPSQAALSYVRIYEPTDRHAVARFLVNRVAVSQEVAFATIKTLIERRFLIECDGALLIPSEEVHPSERLPLWPVAVYVLSIVAVIASLIALIRSGMAS